MLARRVTVISPTDPAWRGCQLSLKFDCETELVEHRLRERGVMIDTRKPDIMRVAPVPLCKRAPPPQHTHTRTHQPYTAHTIHRTHYTLLGQKFGSHRLALCNDKNR